MSRLMIAALAAAALAAPTYAAAQNDLVSNPRQSLANFTTQNLVPLLTELGVSAQAKVDTDGTPYVAAKYGNFSFDLTPLACRGGQFADCIGLLALASFSGFRPTYQAVSAFDERYAFIDAGMFSDGSTAYVVRYDIADYGVARGNVANSVATFVALSLQFWESLDASATTVSHEGYAEDLAAADLNRRQGEAIGIAASAGDPGAAGLHTAAVARIPEIVRAHIAAGETNRPAK